ncbi:MAG: Maf family protein [Gammaproteobacteria bacterium]|nr:Maf family protein [Gammaproteobacteria bacterium]MCZ6825996.1 Maf family protein [Gammaproteobacteria bacterium]
MQSNAVSTDLILASGSRYRRHLLARLALDFRCIAADIDEDHQPGESPAEMAARLAQSKALAVAGRHPEAIIIGSDQVATVNGQIVGKPDDRTAACSQLRSASGQLMDFHTAVHIIPPFGGNRLAHLDTTRVSFRRLDDAMIKDYLDREQVLDCAGSFKSEGLGIALVEKIETCDPTALIGLPLIWLAGALRSLGLAIL